MLKGLIITQADRLKADRLKEKTPAYAAGLPTAPAGQEEAAAGKKRGEVSQPASPAPAPPGSPAKPGATHTHTVAPGENLYRIALRYGLSMEELRRLNNLRPDQSLQVGLKLNVGTGN